ncbi:hypothetical protein EUGRSUZ_K03105 [Eucalyptus grandis]|uniref:Uncharacterized protein n=2 Tax=Eucalyptus grandis TaxID=71139 RepID=A0A059A892_EUCGR|nr:hypothetical protein EUGRSUZ_K03105 [Eucalyptus grandis]
MKMMAIKLFRYSIETIIYSTAFTASFPVTKSSFEHIGLFSKLPERESQYGFLFSLIEGVTFIMIYRSQARNKHSKRTQETISNTHPENIYRIKLQVRNL